MLSPQGRIYDNFNFNTAFLGKTFLQLHTSFFCFLLLWEYNHFQLNLWLPSRTSFVLHLQKLQSMSPASKEVAVYSKYQKKRWVFHTIVTPLWTFAVYCYCENKLTPLRFLRSKQLTISQTSLPFCSKFSCHRLWFFQQRYGRKTFSSKYNLLIVFKNAQSFALFS